jgi:23S rRNA (uracil1939-C5)-methyltransferase
VLNTEAFPSALDPDQSSVPHCRHFGACGGCTVASRNAKDKQDRLREALLRAGYEAPRVAPLVEVPLHSRRRVDLAAMRAAGVISLGLHKAGSAEVVDMQECAVLDPRITALLPALRDVLRRVDGLRRSGSVIINLLDQGADILLRTDATLTLSDSQKLIAFARAHRLPRISAAKDITEPEPIIVLDPPVITLSGIPAEPQPGAFLQASQQGESAILAAVLAGLPRLAPRSRVVELYAGLGTITFALCRLARVEAYEGNGDAVAAQLRALRRNNLGGRVTLSKRDLNRRPLQVADLRGRSAVVLNPPYPGASAQMNALASAMVPRVIYVSCNPQSLMADARVLRQAGYRLLLATPIDQFPYSEHLESVVVLEAPRN